MSDLVYRTELTPVSFLRRSAAVYPDKEAVVHGQRRYSYRELEERVNRLASRLRAAGFNGKGHDRVAFLCPNTPALLEAHFAVPAAGGVLVAINTRLSSDEIGYILRHSGARFLFVDAELEHLIEPLDTTGITIVRIVCREHLAHFKCPAAVEFGELPKTSTGKVQKVVLRDRAWHGHAQRVH
jgi:acyl-CoA synthetase (AMP-forming)/AMP-acid ligase II